MGVQPSQDDSHDVIRLGGETAVVVPMHEYRTLNALRDRASAEQVEEAEIGAAIAEHEAWKAAGRPGLKRPPPVSATWQASRLASAEPRHKSSKSPAS